MTSVSGDTATRVVGREIAPVSATVVSGTSSGADTVTHAELDADLEDYYLRTDLDDFDALAWYRNGKAGSE